MIAAQDMGYKILHINEAVEEGIIVEEKNNNWGYIDSAEEEDTEGEDSEEVSASETEEEQMKWLEK